MVMDGWKNMFNAILNNDPKSPQWLQQLRQENFNAYQKFGLPTLRDEAWKYTNIKILSKKAFNLTERNNQFSLNQVNKELDAVNVFIVNGYFHSMTNCDTAGLTIRSLATAIQDESPGFNKLNQLASQLKHGFAKLNTAFLNDGLYLHLAQNVSIQKPIHVFYINTQTESVQYLRNLIVAETGTSATIIEHYVSPTSSEYCTNTITEIYLDKTANIKHIKLQTEATDAYHIGTTKVQQDTDSHFESYVISLGGKLSRSDTEVLLAETGCYCEQRGLYLGQERQHFDHHTLVDHLTSHCTSKQLYKGILDDAARAVFNGKVYVHPHAIKTDSSQMTKNLLLSDKAEVDAKPELEIYNDDVKCSHGATVGQLNQDQLFYLLSRGLEQITAKSLLMFAFSYEIIATIKDSALRNYLRDIILQNLPAGNTVKELLK